MEQTKSLYPHEFPWPFHFYSSVFTMGEFDFLNFLLGVYQLEGYFKFSLSENSDVAGASWILCSCWCKSLGGFTGTHSLFIPFSLPFFTLIIILKLVSIMQGMIAGHAYYFLAFVYPRMTDRRPLKTPSFLKALFADEPVVVARPEDVRFAHAPFDEIHQD